MENSEIFKDEPEKSIAFFKEAMEVRVRHNQKLIELATFGLQIDIDNPTELQIDKWEKIAQELSEIEIEAQAKQLDFQRIFGEFDK